jgi:hypothetical protein
MVFGKKSFEVFVSGTDVNHDCSPCGSAANPVIKQYGWYISQPAQIFMFQ